MNTTMSNKLDKIEKLEGTIITMEKELMKYKEAFMEDGVIAVEEQEELDKMFEKITTVVEKLFQVKADLPPEIDNNTFSSGTYNETNYSPPTGLGLFDVNLNPRNGRLEILVKVNFDFEDGDPIKFVGQGANAHKWSSSEKDEWKTSYIALIEGRWGGKYHFVHPDLNHVTVYVDVEVEEATSGWHYDLKINKIPDGSFEQSSISHWGSTDDAGNFTALTSTDTHTADLDSEDLDWAHKGTAVEESQKGAVHEFGHMVGLGDEYADGKPGILHAAMVRDALGTVLAEGNFDDVMSVGNHIEKQHYVTFLAALKEVTGLRKWQFKK